MTRSLPQSTYKFTYKFSECMLVEKKNILDEQTKKPFKNNPVLDTFYCIICHPARMAERSLIELTIGSGSWKFSWAYGSKVSVLLHMGYCASSQHRS